MANKLINIFDLDEVPSKELLEKEEKKKHKFDIFKALEAVDKRDGDYFSRVSEEERKGFSDFMFIRWMSCSFGKSAEDNLYVINEFLNPHMFDIGKQHPELVFRLGAMCGDGLVKRDRKWIGTPKRKTADNKAWLFVAGLYPHIGEKEVDLLLRLHTRESFAELIEDAAIQTKEEASELMKSYDNLTTKETGAPEEKPKSVRGKRKA